MRWPSVLAGTAALAACEANVTGGRVYNIACGGRYTINHVFEALEKRIGAGVAPRYEAARAGDVKHSMADISRIRKDLGYEPRVGFEEGIDATVRWYQDAGLKTLG